LAIVELLLESGAEVDITNDYGEMPLIQAVASVDTTGCLLEAGADKTALSKQNKTASLIALAGNHTDTIVLLALTPAVATPAPSWKKKAKKEKWKGSW
jgi:ankyrin repeat protein